MAVRVFSDFEDRIDSVGGSMVYNVCETMKRASIYL